MLSTSCLALTVLFGPCCHDTAAGSWRKQWKHWSGHGESTMKETYCEMDSLSVRCHEEDGYKQRLPALLSEVHRRSTVQTAVATDLLCFAVDFGYVLLCRKPFLPRLIGPFRGAPA